MYVCLRKGLKSKYLKRKPIKKLTRRYNTSNNLNNENLSPQNNKESNNNSNKLSFFSRMLMRGKKDGDEEVNDRGESIKKLLNLVKKEYKLLLGSMAALAVSSAATLIFPAVFGKIIDIILDPNGAEKLLQVTELMGIVSILGGVAAFFRILLITRASERIVMDLRKRLFYQILHLDMAFFDVRKTGELINRLSNDTNVMSKVFVDNLSYGVRRIIEGVGGLIVILYLSPKLTLAMLLVFPPVFLGAVTYGRKIRKLSKEVTDSLAESTSQAEEKFSAVRTVKAFDQEKNEVSKYQNLIQNVYNKATNVGYYSGLFHGTIFVATNFALLAVLYRGGMLIINGELSPGDLTSFLFYSLYVGFAFSGVSSFWVQLQQAVGSSQRVFEILDTIPTIKGGIPMNKNTNGHIIYRNVNFYYPTRKNESILSNFSLEIEPGKSMAIVGYSGSGKSTIASLLFRFYDVNSGEILIDNQNIKNFDPHSMRNVMSYVPQDISLFHGTIAENICYSRPGASIEDVINAAKQANAHNFIVKFKDGYNTQVGEKGTQLSGGQKQRIAIARAILADPKILVLDEATSSLDVESEYLINQALERLMQNRTTLIIAHRLSTIKNADKIGVLHHGIIEEQGTYDELLQKNGIFKQLVDKQLL